MRHIERHRSDRIGWLRAAVLGANDGIVSTASLVIGVAATGAGPREVFLAGVAGLTAGAMSMAAGEYVSVSSQSDTEEADLTRERGELAEDHASEREELARIYVGRGLDLELARQVSDQLMAHDALGAHARDELGISELQRARPVQAALASAASFAAGAVLPLIVVAAATTSTMAVVVVVASLLSLGTLGGLAARVGGAPAGAGAWRVSAWGALATVITYAVGALFGTVV
jgi:VIT1/CCC1 family predicted Fe2+/Mn2+ transporter